MNNVLKYKDFVKSLDNPKQIIVYCNGKRLSKVNINHCIDCEILEYTFDNRMNKTLIEVNGVY